MLRARYSENRAQSSLFVREGRLGCTLRHPNIVPIYEVLSEGRNHFMVMEFVEGRNLREFVRIRKKLDPLEATRLTIGIADGLRYAFEKGLTHRDLKMSNVLVSSRGEAQVGGLRLGLAGRCHIGRGSAQYANRGLCRPGTGDRRAEGRHPKRRLFPRLHVLQHAHRPAAAPRNPRPAPTAEQTAISRRDSHPEGRSDVAELRVDGGKQGDDCSTRNAATSRPGPCSPSCGWPTNVWRKKIPIVGRRWRRGVPRPAAPRCSRLGDPDTGRTVMVVESDAHMQDVFRKGLKKAGYRVLMTADPARALGRFRQDASVADCVFFNAQQIGSLAMEIFNELGEDPRTQSVPGGAAVWMKNSPSGSRRPARPSTVSCSTCRSR